MQPALQPPQAPAQAPQGQPQQPAQPGKPSPEMQQMYEVVVGQSEEYLLGQGRSNVEKRLQAGAEDGVEDDVGAIVGNILVMNYQGAHQSGKTIPPDIIVGAVKELVEVVTDMAVAMKLINPKEADAAADEALYVALSTFGKAVSANMPPEELQQYQQAIQTLRDVEAQAKGQPTQQPTQQAPAQPSMTPGAGNQPVGAMP